MKRLYTLATALAFGATALMAQTMIVVDKSDNQYRFGVDRIAQITFEEAVDPAVEVKPTYISPYDGGNVNFVFQDADGGTMIDLDFYGTTEATYLEAGTYNVDPSNEPFTIDPSYSKFYPTGPEGGSEAIASGKMTVEDNEGVYTFNIELTTAAGTEVKAHYEGTLDSYTSHPAETVHNVTMTGCQYGSKNEMEAGEYYLKLHDANWLYEMTLDLFADPSSTTLPSYTTYTLTHSTDHAIGTMSYQNSSIDIFDTDIPSEDRGNVRFSEATLEVTENNGIYTLVLNATLMNGYKYHITYLGEIH